MLRRLLFVVVLLSCAICFAEYSGELADNAIPAAGASADTVVGWIFKALLGLLIGASTWVAVKVSKFLEAKQAQVGMNTAQTLAWSLTNKVWLKAQAVASKILAKEKALLDKILSDGVVTAEEFQTFKLAVENDLRDQVAEEIPMLGSLIGGSGPVSTLISGFASKVAHNLITGQTSAPTQTPLPAAVPAPAVASPK